MAGRVGAVAVWHGGAPRGSLGVGAGEQRQGKVDAAVMDVPWRCQGGGGTTALLGWDEGSGSAPALAG